MTDIQQELATALRDRYAVERKLGAGGMAIVYLARDLKHDRLVAIKVLQPELAASIGADRFLREIQITAKLSHPHILPLYDSGAAGGFLYYVMPYVEGESLHDLMVREKQLAFEDAIRITREVAEALAYAHGVGLVHRDIKPDNVMLSGGHAVVADFGIARALSQAGAEKLTQTGMAVGTPAYMSPEQALGEEDVDGRSDIYSLGCVLYEMVVGQVPFTGPTPMAVISRHSMDNIPPPHIMRQTIPPDLETIIYTAMAKAPADRYHSAQEMVDELNAVASGTATHRRLAVTGQQAGRTRTGTSARIRKLALPAGGGIVLLALAIGAWRFIGGRHAAATSADAAADMSHIAVMYFADRSPGKKLDYLASGLTEGLIRQLTNVSALRVVSANGVRPFANANVSADSLHKALGVGTLVEGTVAQDGDRLRVGVSLVNALTGDVMADTTIDRQRQDIFALQDELAQDVSLFLRKRLGTAVTLRRERSGTSNSAAWEDLQHAKQAEKDADTLAAAGDSAGVRRQYDQADSLLAAAAALDPKWVAPVTERGWLDFQRARVATSADAQDRWSKDALATARQAFAMDPNDADVLDLRGTVHYWRVVFSLEPDPTSARALVDSAEHDLRAAVQIDPNKADALTVLSHLMMRRSQPAEAKLFAQRAYEADPYLRSVNLTLWRLYQASLDLEQGIDAAHWCSVLGQRFPRDPRSAECRISEQTLQTYPGRIDSAWKELPHYLARSDPRDTAYNRRWGEMLTALVIARAGLRDSARDVAVRARADPSIDPNRNVALVESAVRAWIGDKEEAVRQLSLWLAANQGSRENQAADRTWYWRPLWDYPPYRSLLGIAPGDSK